MTVCLNGVIASLGSGKISSADFNALQNWAEAFAAMNYPSVDREDRDDIIGKAIIAVAKGFSTPQLETVDYLAYLKISLASKFCDFFRSQPDGNLFEQIKDVLRTPGFISFPPAEGESAIKWEITWWRPAGSSGPVQKVDAGHIEELLRTLTTFAEAGIKIQFGELSGFRILSVSIAAFIHHIFNYASESFGGAFAFRAADLKELVASRLWIVSRITPSVFDNDGENQPDEPGDRDYAEYNGVDGFQSREYAFELERVLIERIQAEPQDIVLWMLYMKALDPDTGLIPLEMELKQFSGMPQFAKSALAMKWKKTAEMVVQWQKKGINFEFQGANRVVVDVLGRHFSQYRK